MSRYLKPRDHGYLMEAAACTKVLEDLRRIEAKYARTVEKECGNGAKSDAPGNHAEDL